MIGSFGVTLTFFETQTHYKTDLTHAITLPSHYGYCVIGIYSSIKLYIVKH